MPRTLLIAPAGRSVGLTTATLGLLRALDRQGVRVAFAKPIATRSEDRSIALVKLGSSLLPPEPIPRQLVEDLLAAGDDQTLMERVVEVCSRAAEGADVLVVEGMVPEGGAVYSHAGQRPDAQGARRRAGAGRRAGGPGRRPSWPTPCPSPRAASASRARAARWAASSTACRPTNDELARRLGGGTVRAEKLVPVAIVPARDDLSALRVKDLIDAIDARVLFEGDMHKRRFRDVRLCAMTVPNSVKVFAPDRLLITPADRDDIILAVSLAVLGGMRIAGLVLTGGVEPNERVMQLCAPAFAAGLPVLEVDEGSFQTATRVANVDRQIPIDDKDRVELAMNVVADRIDPAWLHALTSTRRAQRLSPPAFRHRLVEEARAANKRIVLPEGAEPRTVAAAAIVQARGIARCVLLGPPDEIQEQARKQGVKLPATIEIIDPTSVAAGYVERRWSSGARPAA